MGESPLQTPRRLRDVARAHAQTSQQAPPPAAPMPGEGGTVACPSCGASLTLQPATTPAPMQGGPDGPGF